MRSLYTLFLIIGLLIFVQGQMVSAEPWIEDFSDENLDSWIIKHPDPKLNTWQAKKGYLDYNFTFPIGKLFFRYTDILEFKGFPLNTERLNVRLTIIETFDSMVGIVIGQYTENNTNNWRGTYKFFQRSIWSPRDFPGQQPEIPFDIEKDFEIIFNKGHFQLKSERKHILEFHDLNLPTVNCLGIIAYVDQKRLASFQVDDLVISGPNILDVHPKEKAAVLWGELKQH